MALANQEIHENKRLAAIRSSDLLTPLNEADKALVFNLIIFLIIHLVYTFPN